MVLFCCRYSLDEFGTARRTAIVRGFIDALTRGGKLQTMTDLTLMLLGANLANTK